MYGYSTGFMPNQVRNKNTIVKLQNLMWIVFILLSCIFILLKTRGTSIKIDMSNAKTPPNLFGTDRKIAYAKRKYHSG